MCFFVFYAERSDAFFTMRSLLNHAQIMLSTGGVCHKFLIFYVSKKNAIFSFSPINKKNNFNFRSKRFYFIHNFLFNDFPIDGRSLPVKPLTL